MKNFPFLLAILVVFSVNLISCSNQIDNMELHAAEYFLAKTLSENETIEIFYDGMLSSCNLNYDPWTQTKDSTNENFRLSNVMCEKNNRLNVLENLNNVNYIESEEFSSRDNPNDYFLTVSKAKLIDEHHLVYLKIRSSFGEDIGMVIGYSQSKVFSKNRVQEFGRVIGL